MDHSVETYPFQTGVLRSHFTSRNVRRPGRANAAPSAVLNHLPNIRRSRPKQSLQQRSNMDEKAGDGFGSKNDASIFAGNMSTSFIKEISDYLYDLLTDKTPSQRRKSLRRSNSPRRSNEENDNFEPETPHSIHDKNHK
ncbi:hypothetical protein KIN20_004757 [Parelaphostrongylus tenuis]|uniref:Uncharacterized protein n=1 Tax=Parelaphostrongylus tenuis TaxID=148309 RepID=A0AAD5QEN7_PARTN|nr:hypothetical protein KIN20_004757 [Parelaphostrongylus tenuis]